MSKQEIDNNYEGYHYMVLALDRGWRCGYVEIPQTHPLYEIGYSEQLPIKFNEIKNDKIGKRGVIPVFCNAGLKPQDNVSMDLLFDVHGSITFSGRLDGYEGWFIGFDCAHVGDGKDTSIMSDEAREFFKEYGNFDGDIIRTTEYVESECKSLIDQIIKYFKKEVWELLEYL